jgi:hypothetical protein
MRNSSFFLPPPTSERGGKIPVVVKQPYILPIANEAILALAFRQLFMKFRYRIKRSAEKTLIH